MSRVENGYAVCLHAGEISVRVSFNAHATTSLTCRTGWGHCPTLNPSLTWTCVTLNIFSRLRCFLLVAITSEIPWTSNIVYTKNLLLVLSSSRGTVSSLFLFLFEIMNVFTLARIALNGVDQKRNVPYWCRLLPLLRINPNECSRFAFGRFFLRLQEMSLLLALRCNVSRLSER